MSHRRRNRWLRRLAVGLAFASIAAPAAAKYDETGTGSRYVTAGGWAGYVDPATGVPLSAGIGGFESQVILGEDVKSKAAAHAQTADPYLTDVAVRQGESLGGPDGAAQPFAQVGTQTFVQGVTDFPRPLLARGTRPDDLANRFAHSDVAIRTELASSGSKVEWDDALSFGIAGIVLALALGLGLGYMKRPKLAL